MAVRKRIYESFGVYFITFTCADWLPVFKLTESYYAVYKWFNYLKQQGHHIIAFVVMPNHVHVIIAFSCTNTSINTIVSNGKRFIAYELVKKLKELGMNDMLSHLASKVNKTQRLLNKKHQIFEPSFDRKECFSIAFMKQKANYIHFNPCHAGLAKMPEDYPHSSAKYYNTGKQGIYPVITYMELQDIELNKPASS